MKLVNKIEKKLGKFAIKNLILYIVAMNAVVFLLALVDPTMSSVYKLVLIPEYVLKGEVWRLVTYIFIPSSFSPIWIIFVLYMTYLIGTSLEHEWGSFKFNLYYLIGMLGTTIAAFISGVGSTGDFLNLSLLLAFAYVFPNYEMLLFFILPIKVKYLGWIDAALLLLQFISGDLSVKLAIVAAFLNFIIFFGPEIVSRLRNNKKSYTNRKSFGEKIDIKRDSYHRCTVCGITEKDDKNMEFRYCSRCDGRFEYCMDHLKNHEHIKKVIEVDFNSKK